MTAATQSRQDDAGAEDAIRARVAARQDELVALTQDLVRIPTVNPPGVVTRTIGFVPFNKAPSVVPASSDNDGMTSVTPACISTAGSTG